MPSDPLPACHTRIRPDEFEYAGDHHVEALPPCKFCFPEGEVTVDLEDLLVAVTSGSSRRSIHRHQETGKLTWDSSGTHGPDLANALANPNVSDPADIADLEGIDDIGDVLGGGA